jgi:glycogen debranching enzyme
VANRDTDGDGLCEWGGEAVLESVRDARVAIWDEVAYPARFEALDLNCMLVQEANSLAAMARELGKKGEADRWESDASARTALINRTMWDEETGFYYHVDRKDHDFSYAKPNDLKRQEIIGFLPLWAGVADSARAARLVRTLTDTSKFWRQFGVPSLSANDRYFNGKGYWNGPVWVQWDYLIERGLLRYGYRAEARELVDRVAASMIAQLKKDHDFWEFYSPDEEWAGYHATYIWAGIIARMMKDVQE